MRKTASLAAILLGVVMILGGISTWIVASSLDGGAMGSNGRRTYPARRESLSDQSPFEFPLLTRPADAA